jgi:hypothetical protein
MSAEVVMRKPDVSTRTARAARFVLDWVVEDPGHRTRARFAYDAYVRWAVAHEPERALAYSTFVDVMEAWAPIEGSTFEWPKGRAKDTIFLGIRVRREGGAVGKDRPCPAETHTYTAQ